MTQPTISIVMPTFNRLEFLPATVESVRLQTVTSWELIIADDGSDADTIAYLESLTRDERIRLLRLPHSGNPGTARNAAIAAARGPLLAFLDSDDVWAPTKLERQLAVLGTSPDCGWSYTAFVMVDAEGVPLASERTRPWTPHAGWIFTQVVRTTASIRPSGVVASTALVREVGGFDEAINVSEDYDLWLRLALRSPVCVADEALIHVRRHAGSDSRPPGSAHVARDYSLRKLALQVAGTERELLAKERSFNALAKAADLAARGTRWQSVAAVYESLPFSWRYPRWWRGAVGAVARACLGTRARGGAIQRAGSHGQ